MEFALYQGMDLAKETGPLERAAFSWSYTSDDLGTAARYLFEFDREDDFVALFEAQLCQFMWEAIFERPSSEASNKDLRAMLQPRYTTARQGSSYYSSCAHMQTLTRPFL